MYCGATSRGCGVPVDINPIGHRERTCLFHTTESHGDALTGLLGWMLPLLTMSSAV